MYFTKFWGYEDVSHIKPEEQSSDTNSQTGININERFILDNDRYWYNTTFCRRGSWRKSENK